MEKRALAARCQRLVFALSGNWVSYEAQVWTASVIDEWPSNLQRTGGAPRRKGNS